MFVAPYITHEACVDSWTCNDLFIKSSTLKLTLPGSLWLWKVLGTTMTAYHHMHNTLPSATLADDMCLVDVKGFDSKLV